MRKIIPISILFNYLYLSKFLTHLHYFSHIPTYRSTVVITINLFMPLWMYQLSAIEYLPTLLFCILYLLLSPIHRHWNSKTCGHLILSLVIYFLLISFLSFMLVTELVNKVCFTLVHIYKLCHKPSCIYLH